MSTERVLVQRKASETLIPLIVNHMKSFAAGNPTEQRVTALFNETSARRLATFLEEAKQAGSQFLLGDGSRVGGVIQPTVLTDCKPGMQIWDRESFGPGKRSLDNLCLTEVLIVPIQ